MASVVYGEVVSEQVDLDVVEQRVIASLLEKQRTVPGSYPLSLNSLRTACNQTSNRDPVCAYDERDIVDAIDRLKKRDLVRVVWSGSGSRTLKYHQLLDEALSLRPDERAILTMLLLRGPQSAGELRTRTERLYHFADKADVDACLRRMAEATGPLVVELGRRPGQQDPRWAHLLGEVPPAAGAGAVPQDLDVVLADGPAVRDAKVLAAYAAVADDYGTDFAEDLDAKAFDRWLLEGIADMAGTDPVADVGCGPGHTTAVLASAGADVTGFDLSPAMVGTARLLHPELTFEVGELTRLLLPPTAAGWGAITAWYSLAHLAPSELPAAVAALVRVLARDGRLALAVQLGGRVQHLSQWYGREVDVDVVLHERDTVLSAVRAAGLVDVEWYERSPIPDVETGSERLYVLGRRRG